jgi:hypothetical protein
MGFLYFRCFILVLITEITTFLFYFFKTKHKDLLYFWVFLTSARVLAILHFIFLGFSYICTCVSYSAFYLYNFIFYYGINESNSILFFVVQEEEELPENSIETTKKVLIS